MKKALLFLVIVLFVTPALAMEFVRQKNVATYIFFPLVDADGDKVSSASGLDSEIDTYADGSAPDGFADCSNEAIEVGSTGNYYLSLTQAEMNVDYAYVQIKSSSAKEQTIAIRTTVGDPLNLATTDDGGTINVTGGAIDTVTTNTDMRGTDGANTTVPDAAGVAPTATEVVDEWETQSQADPTGFHVNVLEVGGASQTANDNGSDINSILEDTGTTLDTLVKDIPTTAEFEARSDLAGTAATPAEVNAQVLDVINVDTWTLPSTASDVPASPTFVQAAMFQYVINRNKTETTEDEFRLTNDSGTKILEYDLADDDTTFSRSEVRDDD